MDELTKARTARIGAEAKGDGGGGPQVAFARKSGRANSRQPRLRARIATSRPMRSRPMVWNCNRRARTRQAPTAAVKPANVEPTVRTKFAEMAKWVATLNTDKNGIAEVEFEMPENLSGWKIRVWGMGHGTKVGSGEADVVTHKNLILRLQSPRFFVQKDEVVLTANSA